MKYEDLDYKFNQVFYRKVLDDNECKKLEEYYTDLDPCIPIYKKNNSETVKSGQKFLSEDEGSWLKEKLIEHVRELNNNFYNIKSLKFGRFGLLECNEDSDEHDWHHDVGMQFPYSERKITLVIFIRNRDDYEGGQLEFIPKLKEPLKMEKGYMVAFPSHKIHKVSTVTKGLRRTVINWLYEYQPEIDKYII
ncbi:MAG: 2OG-Fe(II) oxygenase [Candidatus Sericytochromatia bacterium]